MNATGRHGYDWPSAESPDLNLRSRGRCERPRVPLLGGEPFDSAAHCRTCVCQTRHIKVQRSQTQPLIKKSQHSLQVPTVIMTHRAASRRRYCSRDKCAHGFDQMKSVIRQVKFEVHCSLESRVTHHFLFHQKVDSLLGLECVFHHILL